MQGVENMNWCARLAYKKNEEMFGCLHEISGWVSRYTRHLQKGTDQSGKEEGDLIFFTFFLRKRETWISIPAKSLGQSRSSRSRNQPISMSRCTLSAAGTPLFRKNSALSAEAPPTAKLAPKAKSSALLPLQYGRTNGRPSASAAPTQISN